MFPYGNTGTRDHGNITRHTFFNRLILGWYVLESLRDSKVSLLRLSPVFAWASLGLALGLRAFAWDSWAFVWARWELLLIPGR
jgi:hypothetical protein